MTFEQMMQRFSQVEEIVLQQKRKTDERMLELERMFKEATRAKEQEQELQYKRQIMEATLASIVEEAKRVAISAFAEKLRSVEARVEALERRTSPFEGQGGNQTFGVEEHLSHLESRIEYLDASNERAVQSVLPRVDVLLNQVETLSTPVALPHSTSNSATTSPSGAASAASLPFSAFASSPAPRPRSASAGSTATPPLTPERRKELGEQLLKATEMGRKADVQRLLDSGADINFCDVKQQTALMVASNWSHINIISLLIEMGADVNARSLMKNTALHIASFNNSGECVSLLIRAGALVDSANSKGRTPLHSAAMGDNVAAARALLAAGASKSYMDNSGKTPSECAETNDLRRLLQP